MSELNRKVIRFRFNLGRKIDPDDFGVNGNRRKCLCKNVDECGKS